jgi:hypothetical protein
MNIEALAAIGVFTLIMGVILLIPGLWWARRKVNELPEHASGRKRVTPFGFVYIGIIITLSLFVFSLRDLAPEVSGGERLALITIIFIAAFLAEKLANKIGIKLIKKNVDGNA